LLIGAILANFIDNSLSFLLTKILGVYWVA